MSINVIFAKNKKNFIGYKGELIYRIKEDLSNFQKETVNNIVVMGVKSFLEIKKPLKDRINVVIYDKNRPIENQKYYEELGILFKPSYNDAIADLKTLHPSKDIFIIGGAKLLTQAINNYLHPINKFIISIIDDDFIGDTEIFDIDLSNYNNINTITINNALDRKSNKYLNLQILYFVDNI